jgi:hypothetical protein
VDEASGDGNTEVVLKTVEGYGANMNVIGMSRRTFSSHAHCRPHHIDNLAQTASDDTPVDEIAEVTKISSDHGRGVNAIGMCRAIL